MPQNHDRERVAPARPSIGESVRTNDLDVLSDPLLDIEQIEVADDQPGRSAQMVAGYVCTAGLVAALVTNFVGLELSGSSSLLGNAAWHAAAITASFPVGKVIGSGLMAGAMNAFKGPAVMFKEMLEACSIALKGHERDLLKDADTILMKEGKEAYSYLVVSVKFDGTTVQRKLYSEAQFERLQDMAADTQAIVKVQEVAGDMVVERVLYQGQLESLEAGGVPAVRIYDQTGKVANEEWYTKGVRISKEYAAECMATRQEASPAPELEGSDRDTPAYPGMMGAM